MNAYTSLATEYEKYMAHVPYEEWKNFIKEKLYEHKIYDGVIAELACGTGMMSRLLANEGYRVIASDLSEDMLSEALLRPHENILYIRQDMRKVDLGEKVNAVICVCNGMNYLMEIAHLKETFSGVYDNLSDGGIFIFDMNSLYKFRYVMSDNDVYDNREDGTFIWENFFDEETFENQIDLTFYVKCDDGRYERFEETHCQKAYELFEVTDALKAAGFEKIEVYDDYTNEPAAKDSEYYTFVCVK